jgi:hypothetical protein
MSRANDLYRPHPTTASMLRVAWAHILSVPYRVSLRWLFYRLLGDGTFTDKGDYREFKAATAAARKCFWEDWAPDTLEDDTRVTIYRGTGYRNPREWLTEISSQGCNLDRWAAQPYYVEIWFEAAAMRSQFEYHTEHVTLRPFKGDYSIPAKWRVAQDLDGAAKAYPGTPIVILYFGDLDPKGLQIPLSAVADVRAWSSAEFEFIRCGLNAGDEQRFNLAENFEKPGTYQWEALDDDAARTLIEEHTKKYLDPAAFDAVAADEARATGRFRRAMSRVIKRWPAEGQP